MAFGIDDAVAAGLQIINKFVPDPQAKIDATAAFQKLVADGRAGQVDLNKVEVQSGKWLGMWRSGLGWGLVASLVYQFILYPFFVAALLIFDHNFPVERLPVLDWKQLGSLLLGMLGLGG